MILFPTYHAEVLWNRAKLYEMAGEPLPVDCIAEMMEAGLDPNEFTSDPKDTNDGISN